MDRIDAILDDVIRRIRSGVAVDIAEYCRDNPELAEEIQLLLPAILLLERPPVSTSAPHDSLPAIPGYHVLRELGRGGMGVVYEAIQVRLNRRVAVKVIHPGPNNRIQAARFCREAETVARLQHSNIVPIFEFGEANGLAYYSMQLIQGCTLEQLIRGVRGAEIGRAALGDTDSVYGRTQITSVDHGFQNWTELDGKPTESVQPDQDVEKSPIEHQLPPFASSFADTARIVLQVAEALSYSHQQGILHRDIKPSNILVDQQGKSWITDFGLAWHADAESLTADGDIVGTVRYLAPEGFRGESGVQSDIYSLGLTLYEMLEGRPAYSNADRAGLMAAILQGDEVELTVSVPTPLARICSKCIRKRPGDRYATAEMLAADLRNFLEQRPITAKPLSPIQRLVRWSRRNRRLTVSTILIAIVSITGWAVVSRYVATETAQRLEVRSQASTELARTNLKLLLDTVDEFCETVSEERRLYSPEFHALRKLLHQSAADLNIQIKKDPEIDPETKLQLASVLLRLGGLGSTEGTLGESEADLLKSLELLRELRDASSENSETRVSVQQRTEIELELMTCCQELGRGYLRMDKHDLSREKLGESIVLADKIINGGVDKSFRRAAQFQKSRSLSILGQFWFSERQFEESESHYAESIRLLREIADAQPADSDVQIELAERWTSLGTMRTANLKVWRQAEEPFREAAALYSNLRAKLGDRPDLDYDYAVLLRRTAKWLYMSKQLPVATETQREANEILAGLADDFDYDLAIQLEFGMGLRQLAGFLLAKDPRDPDVLPILEESEQILDKAVKKDSSDVVRLMGLVGVCQTKAELLQRQKQSSAALVSIDRAITTLALILSENPTNASARESRYFAAVTRAELLTDLERFSEALIEWDLALELSIDAFAEVTAIRRIRTEAVSGAYVEAVQRAELLLSRQVPGKPRDRRVLSCAAQVFAIAARLSGLESTVDSGVSPGELYAQRAIELLSQYLPLDPSARDFVLGCEDFNCLRERPDFQAVLERSAPVAE